MRYSPLEQKIADIAAPVIEDLGYTLVMVEFKGGNLQIMAENPETGNLSIDECTQISRALSPVMEVEDPIEGSYRLEVSSPGIDRPLVRPEDYSRHEGKEAKIELETPLEGQKRFRGVLLGEENGTISLQTDTGKVDLPFEDVHKAKLVMTDALLNMSKKHKQA